MANWFEQNAPKKGNWFEQNAPSSDRPAGLPEGMDLPQLTAHPAVDMNVDQGTVGQKLVGDRPFRNSGVVIAQHLKNLVTAPVKAFTEPAQTPGEEGIAGAQGPLGLGVYRMLAKPTVDAISQIPGSRNATEVMNHVTDAIPIAGPIARGVENDAATYGAVPALLGLGTDMLAPKAGARIIGGAANLGGKVLRAASSTPEAQTIAGTRTLVTGSPGEMLNRALKPPVTKPDFEQSVEATLPEIAKQNPNGVAGFSKAAMNVRDRANQWYQNLKSPYLENPIDTTPLVGDQVRSIPATNLFETPEIAEKTASKAAAYDMTPQTSTVTSPILDEFGKPITREVTTVPEKPTLATVDDIRRDTNAKLNAFYQKTGGDRNAALSQPETARTAAVNHGTRGLVYDELSKATGIPVEDIARNQDLYGHAVDVAEVAGKRATVSGRANPLSLQESLQLHGNPITQAYNFGTSRLFRTLTTPVILAGFLAPKPPQKDKR
jgi:hypothetical protein